MKRRFWIGLVAVVVIAAGVTLVALPKGQEWTTSSPEALAEFEAGDSALWKLYHDEANRHFRRAVELDPDFIIAKLFVLNSVRHEDKEKANALWDEVISADRSKLRPREVYFIERERLYHEGRGEEVMQLIDDYLAKYPNDPYVLNDKAVEMWGRADLEEAERLYQRLVEISPNWVIAYNQLGYINMWQGRFAEAEERFKSYRFIAPDQANPYDSLGELFITVGRYNEAEASFEEAIQIKPDFWAAYEHIALMKSFNGDLDGTREIVRRLEVAKAPESTINSLSCLEQYMAWRNAEAWQEILDASESDCVSEKKFDFAKVTTHLAASKLKDWETAEGIESAAKEALEKYGESGSPKDVMTLRGVYEHMQGVRLAFQGNYGAAADALWAADEDLTYVAAGTALYKYYNRMILAELLLADGQDAEAHGLLSKVRADNPLVVAEFEESGFKALGLDRS